MKREYSIKKCLGILKQNKTKQKHQMNQSQEILKIKGQQKQTIADTDWNYQTQILK